MDKTLNAWNNLYECTVVSDENYLTLNLVTYLEVSIEKIPWVSSKLLQTESDSLLSLIEVKDNNVNLLIKSNNLLRMVDTAP